MLIILIIFHLSSPLLSSPLLIMFVLLLSLLFIMLITMLILVSWSCYLHCAHPLLFTVLMLCSSLHCAHAHPLFSSLLCSSSPLFIVLFLASSLCYLCRAQHCAQHCALSHLFFVLSSPCSPSLLLFTVFMLCYSLHCAHPLLSSSCSSSPLLSSPHHALLSFTVPTCLSSAPLFTMLISVLVLSSPLYCAHHCACPFSSLCSSSAPLFIASLCSSPSWLQLLQLSSSFITITSEERYVVYCPRWTWWTQWMQ